MLLLLVVLVVGGGGGCGGGVEVSLADGLVMVILDEVQVEGVG